MQTKLYTALKLLVMLLVVSVILQIVSMIIPEREGATIDNEHVTIEYIQRESGYYTVKITDKITGSYLFPEDDSVDLQQGFKEQKFVNYIE